MARPRKFDQQNITFTAEGCHDLPAKIDEDGITSCWEFTPEELKQIFKHGCVFVRQTGPVCHPILVMAPIDSDENESVKIDA